MSSLLNFILFQIGWFACIHSATSSQPLLAPLVTAGIVVLHVGRAPGGRRWRYLAWLAGCGALGWALDSGLSAFAITSYPFTPGPPAPLWILCLWLLFATTAHHSLAWLQGRARLACMLGLIGGPLSYLSGVKLGATGLEHSLWYSVVPLAIEYALFTPLMLRSAAAPKGRARGQAGRKIA